MPDESCRTCGGELILHSKCLECRKATQRICAICHTVTEQEYHQNCLPVESLKAGNGMQIDITPISKSIYKTENRHHVDINLSLPNLLLVFNIVGFFILGFATANYFDPYQSHTIDAQIMASDLPAQNILLTNNSVLNIYENCLGYGKGESITISCPTDKGYVYKTTLAMPHDLITKLEMTNFSIRSISISENSDGSVILEYQKNLYPTSFFT